MSFTVRDLLLEAREAIIAAGGEPRSVETLIRYRKTALWASGGADLDPTNWLEASYAAHDEARTAGITYDEFAAMPMKTTDVIRQAHGRA